MFFVGLTGGIASGKSTVTKLFIDNNVPVIDADTIARQVVEPGKKAWKKLKKEFGEDIFFKDGTLNRALLGKIIFENVEKRKKLNYITHPEIIKQMIISAVKLGFQGHPFVVLDIPLLFETGELVQLMHKIIVVSCTEKLQIERLCMRNNLTEEEAKLRISSQMSLDEKCQRADYVIDNSSSFEETITFRDK
ncbi:Dephospho-CoA kinase, putative [Pediculus humanus corporis]|uniref:Dephospho-CoA kinase domain-containing protein n=1 Tax=Pediculus humanus subsp. corporis TaxID=121224 RepID=E0VFE3_PEDHC|nr:Dephospho-CoA kinase, putative [Pediculus humanus corporis]EEB12099.1 Dephospho-CoA kinase, putative [Pediculus humanus corporis]